MWYVYILKSKIKDWRYVGYTSNLKERFKNHNQGKSTATKNFRPFDLVSYISVQDESTAIKLEKRVYRLNIRGLCPKEIR